MNEHDDWSWLRELLTPLQACPDVHPPRAVLHAYLQGRLRDLWRVEKRSFDHDDWTLTEVSQHALVCRDCAQQLALLRQRELEHAPLWRDLWYRFPSAIRAHLAAYVLAFLVLLALNAFLVTMLPTPLVALPCLAPGERAGPTQPADPQMTDTALKFEGLNRPVKCALVPAPRPWWQTWWIGWVFLLWTILLGLHILWERLASPALQRPVTVSSELRSFV